MPSSLKCRDQRREHHPGESEIFFPIPRSRRWSYSPGGRTRSSRAARTCLWHSLPAITPSVPSPGPQTLRNSRQHTLPPQYKLLTLPSPRQPSPNLVVPCTPTVAPLHSPQSLAFPTAALRGRGALSNAGHLHATARTRPYLGKTLASPRAETPGLSQCLALRTPVRGPPGGQSCASSTRFLADSETGGESP